MAEKASYKKQVKVSIGRKQFIAPKVILACSFRLITDQISKGYIEILIEEEGKSAKAHRVIFDGAFLLPNTNMVTNYLAELPGEPDDSCLDEKISYTNEGQFTNIIQVGRSGARTETTFALISLQEWATVINSESKGTEVKTVDACPVLSVYGEIPFQKKLLSEILRVFQCS